MSINIDLDVSWIASALCFTGFLTTVGLAMTVGRCVANWMSTTVELSLRGLRQLNLWYSISPKQSR
ncbi:MAG: hypothetical protein FWC76_05665 [Defluviitaleaceae bacterium]|nr:hypothetical protein [Defluviitaleaceae bacterium]